MQTSWSILKRDLRRLRNSPRVWVIIIGVMITPALYSWFNIPGFWDPYEHTENIGVAIVNEDKGASSTVTGSLNIGNQVVKQLKQNHELGWQFPDAEKADRDLKRGKVYASITIPSNFSQEMVDLIQGKGHPAKLTYRANQKINAISPHITAQGASGIDGQISASFNKEIAKAVTEQVKEAGGLMQGRFDAARLNSADAFQDVADAVANSRDEVGAIQEQIGDLQPTIAQIKKTLGSVDTALDDAQDALTQVQAITGELNNEVLNFSADLNDAYLQGSTALVEGTGNANAAIGAMTGNLQGAISRSDSATAAAEDIVKQADQVIGGLNSLLDASPLNGPDKQAIQRTIDALDESNATNKELVEGLKNVSGSAQGTLDSLNATSEALAQATKDGKAASDQIREASQDALPQLSRALNQLNARVGSYAAALGAQKDTVRETSALLDATSGQLSAANQVLESFKADLDGVRDGLETARLDVLTLGTTEEREAMEMVNDLDPEGISQFLSDPAEIQTEAVFPVDHYGSGMAALFTNLSLWIGAFILIVIFRVEVDAEGFKEITVGQAYMGRTLLLGIIAIFQALIVSIGDIVIGVQNVSAVAFVLTCVVVELCYLAIIYSMVAAFGHVGRGIAVVLAFIQIPGAAGLYPIEMTPDFFQALNPFLPLTYGIDALRETIGGFYSNYYLKNMLTLMVMAVIAYVVGYWLRRSLSSVNVLVNHQLEEGGLVNNEEVHLVGSGYKLSDLVFALRNREEYQTRVDERMENLRGSYTLFMRIAIGVAVVALVILGILARNYPDQKALFFGLACLFVLLCLAYIAVREYVKQSVIHAQELSELSEEELRAYMEHQTSHPHAYSLENAGDTFEPQTKVSSASVKTSPEGEA
ncbi:MULTISPECIES: YhgE/Pip domain-containing protein [Corynebacterium]|uniref:YhgE/Pip domain-containing protein n=1 Tax=Corynebacterium amycolatum TaxID=43765 RepID=A0AB38XW19_CORAY|nr:MULTISPECIES: YhgE/Pip domain-containing protein [Corynebacterium]AIN82570.1 hypothetical protein DR71_1237 [Corynebacterium sp. ATCC 6931]MBC6726053.1 YhgE/Pip domain-containing protein [Corynebacterium amycolatum]MDY7341002.1 YhgE/Pip domain-containing protein [Corynebacterium amycolatum]OFU57711.1 hypothetical protein HMPREF3122_01005 [Corynebacterium sp. HMSC11H10]QRP16964.1 YhgE/Pip domain-containing protein [Corynebacterium amycolatum]